MKASEIKVGQTHRARRGWGERTVIWKGERTVQYIRPGLALGVDDAPTVSMLAFCRWSGGVID